MTKHLADHRDTPKATRKKHFWAIEQRGDQDAPHPVFRSLNQRPQTHDDAARLQQYLRIERGIVA